MALKPYYDEDGITIYHGDCLEILPQLETVDLVLTDPPYGILAKVVFGNGRGWGGWTVEAQTDAKEWDASVPSNVNDLPSYGRYAIIWGGNHYSLQPKRCWLCWVKPDAVRTQSSIELAWSNLDKPSRHLILSRNPPRPKGHPTQKPQKLMRWCIEQADDVATILDPFMGSGTTLKAAQELGRKCIGIEIEEKYCEFAAKRLAQGVLPMA